MSQSSSPCPRGAVSTLFYEDGTSRLALRGQSVQIPLCASIAAALSTISLVSRTVSLAFLKHYKSPIRSWSCGSTRLDRRDRLLIMGKGGERK